MVLNGQSIIHLDGCDGPWLIHNHPLNWIVHNFISGFVRSSLLLDGYLGIHHLNGQTLAGMATKLFSFIRVPREFKAISRKASCGSFRKKWICYFIITIIIIHFDFIITIIYSFGFTIFVASFTPLFSPEESVYSSLGVHHPKVKKRHSIIYRLHRFSTHTSLSLLKLYILY
jgi:hypothetical protein